jgi:MFS family permease
MTDPPVSYRELLATRHLPSLLAATCLSRLAEGMLSLAIVLYALSRFGSAALAGWLSFAVVAPGLAISPLAGTVLDRIGAARAITVDMAASALFVFALVVVDRAGWASTPMLLALAALFSLTSPLSIAGIRTLLPRLTPKNLLDRINALDTAIYALADVIGPALAGTLAGFLGPRWVLTGIALIYAAAAFCLAPVRSSGTPTALATSFIAQTLEGIGLVLRQPTLRGLAISYGLYQTSWGMLLVLVPVFATRNFPAVTSAVVSGLLWAGAGIAGAASALVAGRLRTAGRERRIMAPSMLVAALAVWPIANEFGLSGLVLGVMLAGLASGPIDVALLSLRQRRTDPSQLGRVLAISISLNIAGSPVGSAIAGVLAGWSLPGAFATAGLFSMLGAIATALIPARDHRHNPMDDGQGGRA